MSIRTKSAPSRGSTPVVKRPLKTFHSDNLNSALNKMSIDPDMIISKDNFGRYMAESDPNSPHPLPYRVISTPPSSNVINTPDSYDSEDDVPITPFVLYGKRFPYSPPPTYSVIPIDNKKDDGMYGLPSNLEENKKYWAKLWDQESFDKCVYGNLTESAIQLRRTQAKSRVVEDGGSVEEIEEAEAEAEEGVRQLRRDVKWWLLSVTRPLWVIKGPVSVGKTYEGSLYINGNLATEIWGEDKGDALWNFLHELEKYKYKSARLGGKVDPFLTSIKREQLSSTARNLFGIEHPQSRPMRTFSGVTIEKLLAKPGLGPTLDTIIDDGAKLINDSRWSASEMVEGQLTLRATEVMLAVEDEMVKAQIWPPGVVEDAKKLPREHLHRSQAVRSTYNGKYRPLHHQILEATIDRALEREQQGKTSSRPPTPIAFHPLSVSWGVHERHSHPIDPLVEQYIQFERTARNHVRTMAPSNFEIHLPSFTGSADRLVPNLETYNKCLDKGTLGNLSGTTISETLHYLDTALLKSFKPLIQAKIRPLCPDLVEIILSGAKKLRSSESIPSPYPTAFGVGPQRRGVIHSMYHSLSPPIAKKDEESLQERVAEIQAVIKTEEDYKMELQDAGETWSDAYKSQLESARSESIDIQTCHDAILNAFSSDLSAAESTLEDIIRSVTICLRDPYFLARNSKDSGISYDQVSSLMSRITLRILYFFNGNTPSERRIRDDLFTLMVDTIILSSAIRTPGLAGLYLEAELRRITTDAYFDTTLSLVARVITRLHVDLVGIEVCLTLLSTSQWRTADNEIPKAWAQILGEGRNLPTIHPAFISRVIELQHRICPVVACEESLLYQPSQLLVSGGPDQRRRDFVSVQQTVVRGTIELEDDLPTFVSFPCLWQAGRSRYSRELTNAISRYIQVLHSTERKGAGKGQEGSLRNIRYKPLEVLLAQEFSSTNSESSDPDPLVNLASFKTIDMISITSKVVDDQITDNPEAGPSNSKKLKKEDK